MRFERSRRAIRWVAPVAVCALLAGCNGGTVDRHALAKDGDAVDSLACEGALLAREVASGESARSFVRVHTGALARRASNFEDALSGRPTLEELEPQVRALGNRAGRVATLLDQLHERPTNRTNARFLMDELSREGDCP